MIVQHMSVSPIDHARIQGLITWLNDAPEWVKTPSLVQTINEEAFDWLPVTDFDGNDQLKRGNLYYENGELSFSYTSLSFGRLIVAKIVLVAEGASRRVTIKADSVPQYERLREITMWWHDQPYLVHDNQAIIEAAWMRLMPYIPSTMSDALPHAKTDVDFFWPSVEDGDVVFNCYDRADESLALTIRVLCPVD